jgi:branched-chain amino acid transport system substrate-binding protein
MLRQLKQLGINAKFLTGDGGCSPEMIKLAGDAINATTYCSMAGLPLDKMPGGAKFRADYKARFNGEVQLYAPYAYDAAMAIIKAMEKAGSVEPAKYLPELKKISFDGVTGNVSFDDKGDIKEGAVTMYQFKDGTWVAL